MLGKILANTPVKGTLVSMRTLLWVVLLLDQVFMLLIGSMKLDQYEMTDFVFRERLKTLSADDARLGRALHRALPEVRVLQRVELIIAGSVSILILSELFGPLLGFVYALLLFLLITVLSRTRLVRTQATKLFDATLDVVLKTTKVLQPLWKVIGIPKRSNLQQPASLPELADVINKLPNSVVDTNQKQRVKSVIDSETKVVKDVMTLKKRVITVDPMATLGPVLLSDLQKNGHGYFPVVSKNAEPEGVLSIGDIADIHTAKLHGTIRDIMSPQLVWVEEDTSLEELVQAFLQEKQYLLFVRNLDGEFTGIVTIADLLKQLIGVVKD